MIWNKVRRLLAAALMPEFAFEGDTYAVSAEIFRPTGRGSYHVAGALDLPGELLNAIFERAYRATADSTGDISCVRLEIVAPGMAALGAPVATQVVALRASATVQAHIQAKASDEKVVRLSPKGIAQDSREAESVSAAQPTLFDPGDAEEDDPGTDCDHDFLADGACWKCGALEEVEDDAQDEDVRPLDFLAEKLLEAGHGPKKAEKRYDLAIAIHEHLTNVGIDGEDVVSLWENWSLFYWPLYERLVKASFDPQNAPQRLEVIETILGLAERKGIPADSPGKVWEYFAMHYKASWTVTNGKRKLVIIPAGKVKAGR